MQPLNDVAVSGAREGRYMRGRSPGGNAILSGFGFFFMVVLGRGGLGVRCSGGLALLQVQVRTAAEQHSGWFMIGWVIYGVRIRKGAVRSVSSSSRGPSMDPRRGNRRETDGRTSPKLIWEERLVGLLG